MVIAGQSLFVIRLENTLNRRPMLQDFLKLFQRNQIKTPVPQERNKWQLISRSYAAPVKSFVGINLEELPTETAEKLMLGVTTYLWECLLTGKTKHEEVLGTDAVVLDELMDKVLTFGPQTIRDGAGNTFSLSRHQEYVDPTSLPMRKV